MEDALEGLDVALVRADNPGMLTLTGTNTWLLGRDPCWVVDPGPLLEAHLDAVLAEGERRGGIGGVALPPPPPHPAPAPPRGRWWRPSSTPSGPGASAAAGSAGSR